MHRGIILSKFKDRLLFVEVNNRDKKDAFKYLANYTLLPGLFSTLGVDLTYIWKIENNYIVSPSMRYMHQFDNGAGKIGGANLKTNNIRTFTQSCVGLESLATKNLLQKMA